MGNTYGFILDKQLQCPFITAHWTSAARSIFNPRDMGVGHKVSSVLAEGE